MNKAYHASNVALVGLAPLAIALHPSALSVPIDVALAVVLPVHAHVGMNYIISDYVPRGVAGGVRAAMLGVTGATVLGLLYLTASGEGVVGSVKQLWRGGAPVGAPLALEEEEE